MEQVAEAVARLGKKNIYVEMSHRGSADILKAIDLFGEDHVMFATDWPFDTSDFNIKCGVEALMDRPDLMDKYFYMNAARLLHI